MFGKSALNKHRTVHGSGHITKTDVNTKRSDGQVLTISAPSNFCCVRTPTTGLQQQTQPPEQRTARFPISRLKGIGSSNRTTAYSNSSGSGSSRITSLCSRPSQTPLRVRHELRKNISGRCRRADHTDALACKGGRNIEIPGFLSCRPFCCFDARFQL